MDKYRLVGEKQSGMMQGLDNRMARGESTPPGATTASSSTTAMGPPSDSNEVRITQQGKPRNYISYSMTLLVSVSLFVFHRKAIDPVVN